MAKVLESANFADLENASSSELSAFLLKLKNNYIEANGNDHLLELTFAKAKFFHWAMMLVIISLITQFLVSSKLVNRIMLSLTIGIQVLAIILRVIISGRAPVTNMYETVMFSGLGSLILASIISYYRKEKIYISAGLAYNFCCLMMMNFAYGMLNPGISPLVPVLRDNFWLSTHVTMVVFSYGALALSWALSNFVLIKNRFSPISSAEYRKYSDLIYTCDKYGTICLSAGVILGGVWADYSWGRFWGWDPKETWSLIVLLVYLAILHGKNTSWIPNERFVALNAAAFMSVMMAWFGVNYILAAGLHSYGFSEGGAIFLGSFFAAQISILVVTGFKTTPAID
jgi:cytochrome c-type biogenesis protein CcsB